MLPACPAPPGTPELPAPRAPQLSTRAPGKLAARAAPRLVGKRWVGPGGSGPGGRGKLHPRRRAAGEPQAPKAGAGRQSGLRYPGSPPAPRKPAAAGSPGTGCPAAATVTHPRGVPQLSRVRRGALAGVPPCAWGQVSLGAGREKRVGRTPTGRVVTRALPALERDGEPGSAGARPSRGARGRGRKACRGGELPGPAASAEARGRG